MKELTKASISKLSTKEKEALEKELLNKNTDPVYVAYLIWDESFNDVIIEGNNE